MRGSLTSKQGNKNFYKGKGVRKVGKFIDHRGMCGHSFLKNDFGLSIDPESLASYATKFKSDKWPANCPTMNRKLQD
jgi:hypothetical protein